MNNELPSDKNSTAPISSNHREPTPSNERVQFSVHDEATANWFVRKVKEARAYATHVKSWAEQELRHARRDEKVLWARFGPQLHAWLKRKCDESASRRSMKLPAGTAALRSEPAKVVVECEQEIIDWCEQHLPEALAVTVVSKGIEALRIKSWIREAQIEADITTSVLKCPINNHFRFSGELPTGASLLPAHDALHIK